MTDWFFRPWIGKNYGPQSCFGIPVMVLGESHYDWKARVIPHRRVTVELVKDELDGGDRKRFFTNIVASFAGQLPSAEQRGQFWNSVLFYNYIQGFVGNKPRIRPKCTMWSESQPAFRRVLARYKPRLVAVFGFTLWDELPNWGHDGDPIMTRGQSTACYQLAAPDGFAALAPKLRHPSSSFNFRMWHPILHEAVKRAGGKCL
jgi:hypothetical protein